MNRTRVAWETIPALLIGLALGLYYAWIVSPVRVVDAVPSALRADFKDRYRAVIAAAYAANGDLPRAQARLTLLSDVDPYAALSAQAQRALSGGDSLASFHLAQLASALQGNTLAIPTSTPMNFDAQVPTPANSLLPPSLPNTSTPSEFETPFPIYTATPRPSRTPTPRPGAPFELVSQETVCDETLAEGLLQVIAQTSARRQIPGVELILAWAGGEEHFFTGFKPELGNGYADAILSPGVTYTLRAADGGVMLVDLTPPVCQKPGGETYFGGLAIILQRP